MDASNRLALLSLKSRRSSRTVHSTGGVEQLAVEDALQDAVDIFNLLHELQAHTVPITAWSESAAAYSLVIGENEPAEHQSKPDDVLVLPAHRYDTLYEVFRVKSADNPSDALSMPSHSRLKPKSFLTTARASGYLNTPVRAATTMAAVSNSRRTDVTIKRSLRPAKTSSCCTAPVSCFSVQSFLCLVVHVPRLNACDRGSCFIQIEGRAGGISTPVFPTFLTLTCRGRAMCRTMSAFQLGRTAPD